MTNNFGTVNFEGKELQLTQDAYPSDLCGHEDEYTANAVDTEGNEYNVTWQTKKEFDQSLELLILEDELKELRSRKSFDDGTINRMEEIEKEIEKMENEGIRSNYCEDGSNACDWDEYTVESL